PNPWFFTNLVWDDDLSFEGLIAQFRANLGSQDSLYEMDSQTRNFFLTTGIIPLQETSLDFKNKWLFGAQTGLDWTFQNQSNFRFGVAYYHYSNVEGLRNSLNSTAQDGTAPLFVQRGNNLFDIRNDNDPNTELFALASKFHILNLTGRYDYAGFAPIHVIATADYARNLGFSRNEVFNRTGINFSPRVNAWQAILQVGWPKIRKWADWNLFLAYKYLQRDAVLDAFTDSNFHFGGTDAKGFIVGGRFGLTYHTWLQLRWFSSNAIDGPPLGIDSVLLDLTADL
ncbi:MAG: putative porin, partial [Methylocella sp.]